MAAKKNAKGGSGRRRPADPPGVAPRSATITARKTADGQAWQLVFPRCARDRAEDLEEVRKMIDAGEVEIALDELRWLLSGCSDCLDAHRLLGEIALADEDYPLARGHFGYVHRLGMKALEGAKTRGPLPYRIEANQSFHESGKGLVLCLLRLGKPEMAAEVAADLLRCDPADPLRVKQLLVPDATGH